MTRNAFGHLIVDPTTLHYSQRIDELRRVAGRLMADVDRGSQWAGAALLGWLQCGGHFEDTLGIRPPRGSRRSAARLLRAMQQDDALLRLATAIGCDRQALRILRGAECPPEYQSLRDAALGLRVPTGPHAITRARRRDRERGMTRALQT